jgi:hypothetical protein
MYHCTILEALTLTILLSKTGYSLWAAVHIAFSLRKVCNRLIQAGCMPDEVKCVMEEL